MATTDDLRAALARLARGPVLVADLDVKALAAELAGGVVRLEVAAVLTDAGRAKLRPERRVDE